MASTYFSIDRLEHLHLWIRKSNPNHDERGRFTSGIMGDIITLSNVLSGKTQSITHPTVGEIVVETGTIGKHGSGILHIIEQRILKDGKSVDEVSAMLPLVIMAAKRGKVNRENARNVELKKNGIVAIIRKESSDRQQKWILTGFDDWNEQAKATAAIKTVIAQYGYTPEFSSFRKQVGAVASSIMQKSLKSSIKIWKDTEMLAKAISIEVKRIKNVLDLTMAGRQQQPYFTQNTSIYGGRLWQGR